MTTPNLRDIALAAVMPPIGDDTAGRVPAGAAGRVRAAGGRVVPEFIESSVWIMLKGQSNMKPNLLSFNVSQMIKYAQMNKGSRDQIDWIKILDLDELPAPSYIQVIDDVDNKNEVAYAVWGWDQNDNELRFGKVEVKDKSLQQNGVGTLIMQLVIVIAKFYNVPRITGTIAGDKYLWHWYAKLGFTIHDQNKLLMEFGNSR